MLGNRQPPAQRSAEPILQTPIGGVSPHQLNVGKELLQTRQQQLGARAVMVAPPKLARTNDAALERHYLAVAEAIDIPVVVQDFPPA